MAKLILLLIVASLVWAGLRQLAANHDHAAGLTNQILVADQSGEVPTAAIEDLRDYSHTHMNAATSFTLSASYQRALAAAQAGQVAPVADPNAINAATAACTQKDPVVQSNCIRNYISSHAAVSQTPTPVAPPDQSAYAYNFSSPNFAFDGAGLAFIAAAIVAVLGLEFLPGNRFKLTTLIKKLAEGF